jgi:gamma-glutamyltranspeptidase / glutathione hydrolase
MPSRAAVATAHPISTAIGRAILAGGGNAFDAALAISAALPVVLPHTNGLGSDLFAVIHDGSVETLNASGPSAELAVPERFETEGYRAIPSHGPLASFMVPGLVAGWSLFIERASLRVADLLAPAIRWAREGVPVTPQLAKAIERMPWGDPDWSAVYRILPSGGDLRQPDLARTLTEISSDGGHGFYHGRIARAIEHDMVQKGGLLRFDDLERYRPSHPPPLRVQYRGYDVFTNPPNSQGATALFWLACLQRRELATLSPADYTAALLDTLGPAYSFRARYIGDPDRWPLPDGWLESPVEEADLRMSNRAPPVGRDTTAFSVFDGRVGLSAIQSNYQGFGSGHTVAGTGINLNNRGSYFTLERAHHNVVAPGKKTFHTLMATAAVGPELILLGSMGGDIQPQVHVQVLSGMMDRGLSLQDSIAAPRFAYPATIYGPSSLVAETGRQVPKAPPPGDPSEMGHCHGIRVGSQVSVGIDPRGEGLLRSSVVDKE